MLYLQQFDYSSGHRPGKRHADADTMFRLPALSSILAVFLQLVADSSIIEAAQQADSTYFIPSINCLSSGSSTSIWYSSSPQAYTFSEEGMLCRKFLSSQRHLQVVISDTLKNTTLYTAASQSVRSPWFMENLTEDTGKLLRVFTKPGLWTGLDCGLDYGLMII